MSGITIALSKGRILDETLPLLAAAGVGPSEAPEDSRQLIVPTARPDVRLVIVRASDTPTYVQYGAADLGIAPDLAYPDWRALLAAERIGYSTGPSGTALLALFERWGLMERLRDRLVQARAGVPVAQLVAQGAVSLGFQQRSEMLGAPGIVLLPPLPAEAAIRTVFSAAYGHVGEENGRNPASSGASLLSFLMSEEADPIIRRHGMARVASS